MQTGDTLTYPLLVGSGCGKLNFTYVYQKATDGASSIKLVLGDDELETLNLKVQNSDVWETVNAATPLSLSLGYHEIKIVINGSDDHLGDYFVIIPIENTLYTSHPQTLIDANEKILLPIQR